MSRTVSRLRASHRQGIARPTKTIACRFFPFAHEPRFPAVFLSHEEEGRVSGKEKNFASPWRGEGIYQKYNTCPTCPV
jgi:hypothetical protein